MRARGQARSRLEAVPHRHRNVKRVEKPVVRVAARRNVPLAEVLRIHGGVHPAAPPTPAGHEVGDEPVQPSVDQHGPEVDREVHRLIGPQSRFVADAADGAAQVSSEKSQRRYRLTGAPSSLDDAFGLRRHFGRRRRPTGGRPGAPMLDPSQSSSAGSSSSAPVPTTDEAAITPLKHRSAAWAATRRVPAFGAASLSCRRRSISCFVLRTKSPPDKSSSSSTPSSSPPAAQAWAKATNPGSGSRVCDNAASCSSVLSSRGETFDLAVTLAGLPRREPGRRRRRRAAVLVREHGHQAGHRCRIEIVEQTRVQRLRDQQIALVVEVGEAVAFLGERPSVEVAPRLEHTQHAVEMAGERPGLAFHAPLEVIDLGACPPRLCESA